MVKPSDLRATYRYPFGQRSGEPQWTTAARAVPRGDRTCAAPRDNTSPLRLLSAGANLGFAFPSPSVLHPGDERTRLVGHPWPDLRRGPRRRRLLSGIVGCQGGAGCGRWRRPSRHAQAVLSAVSPERLVGGFERRRRTPAGDPDAFDGVARPQPGCDLVSSLNKTGVRLVIWIFRRVAVRAGLWWH